MKQQQHIEAVCVQLCSQEHIEDNLAQTAALLAQVEQADVLLLPENFACLSKDTASKEHAATQATKILAFLSEQAKSLQCWLIGGSILLGSKHAGRYYNHCPVFSPDGNCVAYYNKMHLFDVDLPQESWHESEQIIAGDDAKIVYCNHPWRIGLSICYDLRFPELYRHYSQQGCNILSVPAAFTVPTGQAHWQALLQARAIENQSYVLAAGQTGKHDDGRQTWGHSMIIDPWGEILTQLKHDTGILRATLSLEKLQQVRQHLPSLQHRKVF